MTTDLSTVRRLRMQLQTTRIRRLLANLALVTSTGMVVFTQESPFPTPQVQRVFTIVTERQGELVSGLTEDDFVLLDDGRPQKATLLENAAQPILTMVMIDRSASMADTLEPLIAAVSQYVSALRPQDQVRGGTFSDTIQFTSHFTSSRDELATELRRLPFGNGTRLHDALVASFDSLKGRPGLHVVIAITDGNDTTSRVSLNKVIERERMDGVIVYTIGLHTKYFNGQQMVQNRPGRTLRDLAEQTGGSYFDAPQVANVGAILSRIGEELRGHYLLGLSPESTDRRVHKISVEAKRPGVTVRSRRSYLAPPSNP